MKNDVMEYGTKFSVNDSAIVATEAENNSQSNFFSKMHHVFIAIFI